MMPSCFDSRERYLDTVLVQRIYDCGKSVEVMGSHESGKGRIPGLYALETRKF
jgi:hypothetical protein